MWRKRFKTVFLGVLYGLGKASLAERLNCSIEEADRIIQGLYTAFPKLREYVAKQQEYPMTHNGYINTFLGDTLRISEYKWWQKATSDREKKNLEARIARLAVNLPIQGGTSSIMSSGFFNILRESVKEGWRTPLQTIITVHDSNTCIFPTEKIFDIQKYYYHNFTDFCYDIGKIKLVWDLLVSDAYEASTDMKQVENTIVEFKGSADSCLRAYDKIMNCKHMNVECNMKREEIIPSYIEDAMQRFIMEEGTSIMKDTSSYTVQFKKV